MVDEDRTANPCVGQAHVQLAGAVGESPVDAGSSGSENSIASRTPSAFECVLREIDRIWDAADKADSKILQVISVLAAVFGGLLALTGAHSDDIARLDPFLQGLVAAGFVLMLCGLVLMFWAVRASPFYGAVDPVQVAREPRYLDRQDDFERAATQAAADAFRLNRVSIARKWRWFHKGLIGMAVGVLVLMVSLALIVTRPSEEEPHGPQPTEPTIPTEPATSS